MRAVMIVVMVGLILLCSAPMLSAQSFTAEYFRDIILQAHGRNVCDKVVEVNRLPADPPYSAYHVKCTVRDLDKTTYTLKDYEQDFQVRINNDVLVGPKRYSVVP